MNKEKNRSEIEEKYKWHLEDIYKTNDDWEKDFIKIKNLEPTVSRFKGKLADSPQTLLECLDRAMDLQALNDKLFVYTIMRFYEDGASSLYQGLLGRAQSLLSEVSATVSFIEPEIIKLPEDFIDQFFKLEEAKKYHHYIDNLQRVKSHFLAENEEEIISKSSEMAGATSSVFGVLNDVDLVFPNITDENGKEVGLTDSNYSTYIISSDRRVRKEAFEARLTSYEKFRNTFAALLINNVKKNRFYSELRGYKSSLEMSLSVDNIDTKVYRNLIQTVHENLPIFAKYLDLRKKALKLDELHLYDQSVPLITEPRRKIDFEEAKKIVRESLKPLGPNYLTYVDKGFSGGWIDVFPNKGKRSGACENGAHDTHPYILLNYQSEFNDVFALTHELGHAIHACYGHETQPFVNSYFTIFTAEVASTVNELLLNKYFIKNAKDKKEKSLVLSRFLDQIRTTIIRQTMFAEFEMIIHDQNESGQALTTDSLVETYYGLNQKYYGKDVAVDTLIGMEWSMIPHFYESFYVYKYATGLSAAIAIVNKILTEGEPAVKNYLKFLKSGGSDYPIELLKIAGVDLATPKPIEDAFGEFEKTLTELEKILTK
jgi:oligoendopeptidase F